MIVEPNVQKQDAIPFFEDESNKLRDKLVQCHSLNIERQKELLLEAQVEIVKGEHRALGLGNMNRKNETNLKKEKYIRKLKNKINTSIEVGVNLCSVVQNQIDDLQPIHSSVIDFCVNTISEISNAASSSRYIQPSDFKRQIQYIVQREQSKALLRLLLSVVARKIRAENREDEIRNLLRMDVFRANPWVLFYISCRYPAILIPSLVQTDVSEWAEVVKELKIRFPQPYCCILKKRLDSLKQNMLDGKSDVQETLENLIESCCGNAETIRLGKSHFEQFITVDNLRLFYPFISKMQSQKKEEFIWTMLSSLSWTVVQCILDFIASKPAEGVIAKCEHLLNYLGETAETEFLQQIYDEVVDERKENGLVQKTISNLAKSIDSMLSAVLELNRDEVNFCKGLVKLLYAVLASEESVHGQALRALFDVELQPFQTQLFVDAFSIIVNHNSNPEKCMDEIVTQSNIRTERFLSNLTIAATCGVDSSRWLSTTQWINLAKALSVVQRPRQKQLLFILSENLIPEKQYLYGVEFFILKNHLELTLETSPDEDLIATSEKLLFFIANQHSESLQNIVEVIVSRILEPNPINCVQMSKVSELEDCTLTQRIASLVKFPSKIQNESKSSIASKQRKIPKLTRKRPLSLSNDPPASKRRKLNLDSKQVFSPVFKIHPEQEVKSKHRLKQDFGEKQITRLKRIFYNLCDADNWTCMSKYLETLLPPIQLASSPTKCKERIFGASQIHTIGKFDYKLSRILQHYPFLYDVILECFLRCKSRKAFHDHIIRSFLISCSHFFKRDVSDYVQRTMQDQYVRQLGVLIKSLTHRKVLPTYVIFLKSLLPNFSNRYLMKLTQVIALVTLNAESKQHIGAMKANLRRICKTLYHQQLPATGNINYKDLFGKPSKPAPNAIPVQTNHKKAGPVKSPLKKQNGVETVAKKKVLVKTFLGKEEEMTDDELPDSDIELEDLSIDEESEEVQN